MSEIKKNDMTGEWVLIAEERANRPKIHGSDSCICPFCPGNEYMTPKETYRSANGRIRVIPNKFPAIREINVDGKGIHEVLIDTASHTERLHEFSVGDIAEIFIAFRARFEDIRKSKDISYIQIFKNEGSGSGASIEHSHWQILAVPFVPETQRKINEYFKSNSTCHICDLINEKKSNVIYENAETVVFCPPAPRFENEVWLAPKKHIADITEFDGESLISFCEALQRTLRALVRAYDCELSYNICFYNTCVNTERADMHFFAQIAPRNSGLGGFEISTGSYINAVSPEKSSEKLCELVDLY